MIAGLEEITDGELFIGDRLVNNVAPSERGTAMVFQSYALYPHMTVAENMGFALKVSGKSKDEIKAAVTRAADILQITHLLDRRPKELSGGQRQRVAIGRAIVRKPKVFLFDEPLSNLDAGLRVQMRIELAKLHSELGTTMIYVTHDQVEAMTLGDRIVVFNAGNIEQVGAPLELYNKPSNRFVAGFLGSPKMNFMSCQLHSSTAETMATFHGGGGLGLGRALTGSYSGDVTLGVRPEHLEIAPAGQGIPARFDLSEHLGDSVVAYFETSDKQTIAVKLPGTHERLKKGAVVSLKAPPEHLFVFRGDKDGKAIL
jgi:multiple sugar transport system ATP-binding protein